jgi:trimethylamine:corrinoid methyltransferase-like protein
MSTNIKSISNPKLKLEILTTEEVRKIPEATLWLIEHVGVRFPSKRALEVWEANGAAMDRRPYSEWEEKKDDARDWAAAKTRKILAEHCSETLDPKISAEMAQIIRSVEKP